MDKSILQKASDAECWMEFLNYKIERQHISKKEEREIRNFIENQEYLPICERIKEGKFPSDIPVKRIINKSGTKKKRIVYSFAGTDGIFLKFIAFHLYKYDKILCDNCYAFRRKTGVKSAIKRLKSDKRVDKNYCLKADISNYFNSINVKKLMNTLDFIKDDDRVLYDVFERILLEDRVYENGKVVHEQHGAMAGTPISPFLANIYLRDMDMFFKDEDVFYFRYSDDILIFADNINELELRKKQLKEWLDSLGLTLNQEKVSIYKPGEKIEFLGFAYKNGEIDLSDNTIKKIQAKIKRKADTLRRWQRRKNLSADKAAIGFIHAMNRKFYGKTSEEFENEDEFTWNRWFFPNLTVDTGLKKIDTYMQEYIRYTVTGRHYKGNYKIRYETMKEWGYMSLVHEYYKWRNNVGE